MWGVSLLLCTHCIKSRFNVGYYNMHFAFNVNLVAIVTMLYSLCNGPLLHNIPHTGKLRIVTCNYVILSQVNLSGTIFPLQKFWDTEQTRHQERKDPRQMQQLSQRPWQSLAAHQGAAAPSLGTAGVESKNLSVVSKTFLTLILSASPNIMHFVRTFSIMRARISFFPGFSTSRETKNFPRNPENSRNPGNFREDFPSLIIWLQEKWQRYFSKFQQF